MRRFKTLILGVTALCLLAAIGVALYLATRPRPKPETTPWPQQQEAIVADFDTGATALDVGFDQEAGPPLLRAAQLAPREPAIWADLALWYLRSGNMAEAATALDRAQALPPHHSFSPYITMLRAVLDRETGKDDEAHQLLRQVVEQEPGNARARYGLYTDLESSNSPEELAEARRQLEGILRLRPDNSLVRVQLAILELRQDQGALAKQTLAPLQKQAPAWPSPVAREQYKAVEQALSRGNMEAVAEEARKLANALKSMPAGLTTVAGQLGLNPKVIPPLMGFFRLAVPHTPPAAPADEVLAFHEQPIAKTPTTIGSYQRILAVPLAENPPPNPMTNAPPAIFAANGQEVRRLDQPGTAFPFPGGAEQAAPSSAGVLPLDWNNDYRIDFFLAGAGGIRFMEQGQHGHFTDVTARTKLPAAVLHGNYYGAWAIDIEMDGDLDIVLAPRHGPPLALQNNRNGTWSVRRPFANVTDVRAFVWADLDQDGIPDVAMLDAAGRVHAFINERAGRFRPWAVPIAQGQPRLLDLIAADLDNGGTFALLAVRADGAIVRFGSRWEVNQWQASDVVSGPPLSGQDAVGTVQLLVGDLDNNGSLDLIRSEANTSHIWLSSSAGKFSSSPKEVPAQIAAVTNLEPAGRLELLGISARNQPVHYVIQGTKNYRWQIVRPRGLANLADGRINSFGIGGEVQIRAGLLAQKQLITGPRLHFGLGEHPGANVIRIVWPNGTNQAEFSSKADQPVDAIQRLKGSCPWLFAYDGQRVRFVTDLLWRSPLGLRLNAQDTAGTMQTEDWVKIRGDQLRPHDGSYDVRITAELWETHFFDLVHLLAVDHPAGTSVFVDERFAVPPPPLKVQLMTPPRPVRRAWDETGRDVTELVRYRDGRYLDTFRRGRFQGLAHDHWVEVELDEPPAGVGPLWLIAQGWTHPTDSSINVAIAQAHAGPPRGLSLEVSDGRRGWKTVRDNLGFPEGKNKTILLNLDGVFSPGTPRRLRLRTNMEIYWDALASARGLDTGQMRTPRLLPAQAVLRYRGFSRIQQADANSPELPDYDRLDGTRQRWRDLVGFYTRFGDVRELLREVDDRYVIMNAGDELALRFPALPEPAAGWTRDFVLISDGWEKDGDYNTAFSATVLPLPAHDQPAYDRPPGRLEDDPVYRRHPRDWQRYHTRYVTPAAFERGLWPGKP